MTLPLTIPSPGNPFLFNLCSLNIDPVWIPVANCNKCLTHVFPEPGFEASAVSGPSFDLNLRAGHVQFKAELLLLLLLFSIR